MGPSTAHLRIHVLFLITVGAVVSANASPSSFTYQGKITNTNGSPLEYQAVSFEFSITNPDGSCVIYRERKDGVDMRNSKGLFDTSIGAGTKQYPAAPSFNLFSAFANSGSLNCESGGTYSPLSDDVRKLRVQFYDGSGWRLITPDSTIRSVPFAGYAESATTSAKLGTNVAADFQLKNDIPVCTGAEVLTSTVLGTMICVAGGGGGSGTVTSIATGTGLSGGPITTTGTISLADVGGLTPGSYGSATTVPAVTIDAKGRVTAISTNSITGLLPAAGGASGKYLKSDGTNWAAADIRFSDIKNSMGASAFNTASCAANQTVNWSSLTDMFECQNISEADPKVGANTTNYLSKWNGTALVTSGVFENSGNVGIGTASPSRNLEVSGNDVNTGIRVVNTTSSTTRGPNVSIRNYTNGHNGSPYLELLNSGGTQSATVAVVSNQILGTVGFLGGYNTSGGYAVGASITAAADDNFSGTSTPGRILFKTTPSGSITDVERMRITSSGEVIIAGKLSADQAYVTLTDGGTVTWTLAGIINNAAVTLAGNRTLAFSGLTNGMTGTLIINQDGTGGRTLTLPAQCVNKVVNGGGGAITLSAGANAIDILTFTYDGTNCYWTYGKNYN